MSITFTLIGLILFAAQVHGYHAWLWYQEIRQIEYDVDHAKKIFSF